MQQRFRHKLCCLSDLGLLLGPQTPYEMASIRYIGRDDLIEPKCIVGIIMVTPDQTEIG